MMPVVHDRATEVTQNKPENCPEDCLECRIHDGKNSREEIAVKRKSSTQGCRSPISVELENHLLHRITPHWSERLPMQRRRTILLQRSQMLRSAVTLMGSQAVLGEDRIPFAHHAVALDLRENGSRRDCSRKRVP